MRTFITRWGVLAGTAAGVLILLSASALSGAVSSKRASEINAWARVGQVPATLLANGGTPVAFNVEADGTGLVSGTLPAGSFAGVARGRTVKAAVLAENGKRVGIVKLRLSSDDYQDVSGRFIPQRGRASPIEGVFQPRSDAIRNNEIDLGIRYRKALTRRGVRLHQTVRFRVTVRNRGPDVLYDEKTCVYLLNYDPDEWELVSTRSLKRCDAVGAPTDDIGHPNAPLGALGSVRDRAVLEFEVRVNAGAVELGRLRLGVGIATPDGTRELAYESVNIRTVP